MYRCAQRIEVGRIEPVRGGRTQDPNADYGLSRTRLCATIVAMGTESPREVRDHFSEVVDRVAHEHERVTATHNGPDIVGAMERAEGSGPRDKQDSFEFGEGDES